jgi:predicted nucleic acid-binding protein
MLLVDSNVILDVLCDDPTWAQWSREQLRARSLVHPLAINGVIYSEISTAFGSISQLERTIDDLGLRVLEIPRPALFLAGKAFLQYRRHGGAKQSILADFFIGAHDRRGHFAGPGELTLETTSDCQSSICGHILAPCLKSPSTSMTRQTPSPAPRRPRRGCPTAAGWAN